jgi:hypothetical protein
MPEDGRPQSARHALHVNPEEHAFVLKNRLTASGSACLHELPTRGIVISLQQCGAP